jgi:DNA-binding protein HU-beta
MSAMTKVQLAQRLAQTLGEPITKKKAGDFLDTLAEIALKETKKTGIFILPGLGRLVKVQRKARLGRNPATGQQIQIKAKTAVKFRVSKSLKDAIWTGKAA